MAFWNGTAFILKPKIRKQKHKKKKLVTTFKNAKDAQIFLFRQIELLFMAQ